MKEILENLVFRHRKTVVILFLVLTAFMLWQASHLKIDAGFAKLLPLKHPYMQTYLEYREAYGGANKVVIAIRNPDGDIFTPEFFEVLADVTDEVFFIPGVDRTRVMSLFTPNVRFTEVVEDGIAGGNVIPADFEPTAEGLAKVRENILKSNYMGRLVANDFSAAIVVAELLEVNPDTGEKVNVIDIADQFEGIREKYSADETGAAFDYHIIGFAKVIGDIAAGAARVVLFFLIAFAITAIFVYVYSQSFKLTVIVVGCSLMAVIWQLGLLTLLGFGIDPMSILVPFLVFAIGVSHGVQMVSAFRAEVAEGSDSLTSARSTFRRLLVPGGIALLSDTIGFITIMLIEIRMIQEMAITASLGVAIIILTDLILVPVLLSHVRLDRTYMGKMEERADHLDRLWAVLSKAATPRNATVIIAIAAVLFIAGGWKATQIKIGDLHAGVPELRATSQYNIDTDVITSNFAIGVDVITAIIETHPEACTEHATMSVIDDFEWTIRNVEGVQSVFGIAAVAKIINAGWNEGSLKWRELPRNPSTMAQAVTYIDTSTGLLNGDCSVMPVYIYTVDHKAETIDRVVAAVKAFNREHGSEDLKFRLATGNVGVMAATNEAVSEAQFPMLMWVFAAIILLCLITFRSLKATLSIVIPLSLVSILAYALMAYLEIGLKTSTLPVVALGVGIGVDYGIYIYSRFKSFLADGLDIQSAYLETLRVTGVGVVFTGITLAMGVATWIFAPIKFQADMGILLTFMFLLNMAGAIVLLPALACWLKPKA
ncbi:MAG: MMPL family transporter [Candidatus Sulfomarinibacteraceae bacterium]